MTQPAGPLLDVIIFGGTGDLSLRKLLPALYQLTVEGHTTQIRKILCCARHPISRDELHQKIAKSFAAHKATVTETGLGTFLQHVDYAAIDVYQPPSYVTLTDSIEQYDLYPKLFYFATAPELYGPICRQLSQQNLITKGSRVVLEKPIGSDLESCKTINAQVGEAFSESAIFRIDHYLGKETVQNLIALRFGNSLLAPIWNSQYISNVQITVAETVGIEGRTSYYTKVGAFKDMVQNHLVQLLCLVAMEPPNSLHADAIRDEKVKVLRALTPFDDQTAQKYTVRGQYQQGNIQGEDVRAYGEEINDTTDSHTETFCALKICVDNWRWTGVPFYIRTGKRLARRFSEIVIEFKPQPFSIFERQNGESGCNRLLIRLQPEENITLWMFGKKPELAPSMSLQSIPLDLTASHRADNDVTYDAYVRLLLDVINNNQTLFMRRDEVETAWSWADSLVGAWQANAQPPLSYPAGGMGPEAAARLIGHDNLRWFAG